MFYAYETQFVPTSIDSIDVPFYFGAVLFKSMQKQPFENDQNHYLSEFKEPSKLIAAIEEEEIFGSR